MNRPFYWLDAFTDTSFGGNPCAVVLDADGLSATQMQTLALEMGLSETAFVMKSKSADFAARYFTPGGEIPLAGHPTIASVRALIAAGRLEAGQSIRLELPAGIVNVTTTEEDSPLIAMEQLKPEFLTEHDRALVAGLFGLDANDLIPKVPVQTVSTGTPQLMIAVKDIAAVRKAAIDIDRYQRYRQGRDCSSAHIFCPTGFTAAGATFARHFSVPPDPIEDPFTGSATGGMAAFAYRYGLIDSPTFIAEQGHDLGRPGSAQVEVLGPRDDITAVIVGGRAVVLVTGTITV